MPAKYVHLDYITMFEDAGLLLVLEDGFLDFAVLCVGGRLV